MSLSLLDSEFARNRPVSRKDAVLTVIRRGIIEGILPPGARLDAEKIAEQLGCSRMPVRDALKELEAEGLVTCYPARGTEVSKLAAADIEQIFGIRLALEKLAVTRAVANFTSADLIRLHDLVARMDVPLDLGAWLALNEEFHRCINLASGWPRLVADIERQRRNIERYLRVRLHVDGRQSPQDEHWALYEACKARDAEAACAVLEMHLTRTARMLAEQNVFSSPQEDRQNA